MFYVNVSLGNGSICQAETLLSRTRCILKLIIIRHFMSHRNTVKVNGPTRTPKTLRDNVSIIWRYVFLREIGANFERE